MGDEGKGGLGEGDIYREAIGREGEGTCREGGREGLGNEVRKRGTG